MRRYHIMNHQRSSQVTIVHHTLSLTRFSRTTSILPNAVDRRTDLKSPKTESPDVRTLCATMSPVHNVPRKNKKNASCFQAKRSNPLTEPSTLSQCDIFSFTNNSSSTSPTCSSINLALVITKHGPYAGRNQVTPPGSTLSSLTLTQSHTETLNYPSITLTSVKKLHLESKASTTHDADHGHQYIASRESPGAPRTSWMHTLCLKKLHQ